MGVFWFVIVAFVVASWVIAYWRKGTVVGASIGSRRKEMFCAGDVATVYERIASIREPKLMVDDKDDEKKIIVLSSPITFFTFGFFYPVFLHAAGTGTRIEIGCQSKVFQIGPLVTRAHDQCEAAIRAALGVPEARVA